METLREVVIDEARWPRMFAKLRRAGMYSNCGCAGCSDCQAKARRFLLGVARTGTSQPASLGRRWPDALPVVGRNFDNMGIQVLLDSDDGSRAIDIALDTVAVGPTDGETESLKNIVARHYGSDLRRTNALMRSWGNYSVVQQWFGPISGAGLSRLHPTSTRGVDTSAASQPLRASLGRFGVYLIAYSRPDARGVPQRALYLGRASEQSLYEEIRKNLRFFTIVLGDPSLTQVYWKVLPSGSEAERLEKTLQLDVANAARTLGAGAGRRAQFNYMGFSNAKVGEI